MGTSYSFSPFRDYSKMPSGMPIRDKEIMEKLFDLNKLTTSEIASVLGCSVQVVQKRKREYEAKGTITAVKEMSWQKIKPEHREVGRFPRLGTRVTMRVTVLNPDRRSSNMSKNMAKTSL